jgi:Lipid A 3-O-deacylase (PagL)
VDQTFTMNPYWAASVSRRFFFNERGRRLFLGGGLLFKPRQKVADVQLHTPITTANVLDPAPVNFHWQLGLQYQRWRLVLRHTSNAHLYSPNFGQNVLMFEARLGAR